MRSSVFRSFVVAFAGFCVMSVVTPAQAQVSLQDLPPVPVLTGQPKGNGGVNVTPSTESESPVKVPTEQVYNPDEGLAPSALAPFGVVGGANWHQDPINTQATVPMFTSSSNNQNNSAKKPSVTVSAVETPVQAGGFDPLSPLGLAVMCGTLLLLTGAGWYVVKRQ